MPQSRHRRRVPRRRPPECARLARFTRRSWDSSGFLEVSFAPTGHSAGCASRLRSVAAGSGSFGLRQRFGSARVAAIATPGSRDLARRNLMPSLGRPRAQSAPLGRHTSPKFWERDAVSLPGPRNFHQPILCRAASEGAGRARAAANAVIDEKPAPCAMLGLGQGHEPRGVAHSLAVNPRPQSLLLPGLRPSDRGLSATEIRLRPCVRLRLGPRGPQRTDDAR